MPCSRSARISLSSWVLSHSLSWRRTERHNLKYNISNSSTVIFSVRSMSCVLSSLRSCRLTWTRRAEENEERQGDETERLWREEERVREGTKEEDEEEDDEDDEEAAEDGSRGNEFDESVESAKVGIDEEA